MIAFQAEALKDIFCHGRGSAKQELKGTNVPITRLAGKLAPIEMEDWCQLAPGTNKTSNFYFMKLILPA